MLQILSSGALLATLIFIFNRNNQTEERIMATASMNLGNPLKPKPWRGLGRGWAGRVGGSKHRYITKLNETLMQFEVTKLGNSRRKRTSKSG